MSEARQSDNQDQFSDFNEKFDTLLERKGKEHAQTVGSDTLFRSPSGEAGGDLYKSQKFGTQTSNKSNVIS